jgi:hypothetical protein
VSGGVGGGDGSVVFSVVWLWLVLVLCWVVSVIEGDERGQRW